LVGDPTTAFDVSTLAFRPFFGSRSFGKDGLRDCISFGLELKETNNQKAVSRF